MTSPLVVSVFMDRDDHQPQTVDWRRMLALLDASARKFGCRHVALTDPATAASLPCDTYALEGLPHSLMPAIIRAQRAFLASAEFDADAILVGADCLVNRDPRLAFEEAADIIVTSRPGAGVSAINNGAVYCRLDARAHAVALYDRAIAACRDHWGGDQEAVTAAVAPVPAAHTIEDRHGARIGFRSLTTHNHSPDRLASPSEAYIVHFKGGRKRWMVEWARQHLQVEA